MWKNEEKRILDIKEKAKKFKEVFEEAVINKNKEALNQMIYELNEIKAVWELGETFGKLAAKALCEIEQKLEKEEQSRKDKN